MSAADKSSMGWFMSSEGTDAATANVIAGVVSDVWRAHFGNEWVPFSVRYGIAHEVQRRLAQRSADPSPCCADVSDNVTRIHPAPSIPNPLTANPWAVMTDAELDAELLRTEVRIDAVRHTLDSLTRERARRDGDLDADCPECGDIGCRCGIDWTSPGPEGSDHAN